MRILLYPIIAIALLPYASCNKDVNEPNNEIQESKGSFKYNRNEYESNYAYFDKENDSTIALTFSNLNSEMISADSIESWNYTYMHLNVSEIESLEAGNYSSTNILGDKKIISGNAGGKLKYYWDTPIDEYEYEDGGFFSFYFEDTNLMGEMNISKKGNIYNINYTMTFGNDVITGNYNGEIILWRDFTKNQMLNPNMYTPNL